ncbi:MAG TPA: chorismate mutase [Bacteroidales bacterium]|nr:chorismate mutase [Bacteroidales bacterium]
MNYPEVSNLEEVRGNIDRIDRQIVALLAERQYFVKHAARFKNSTDDVKAPARVEAVIVKVRNLSNESGLDPNIAEAIYRTMIDCFINNELNEFQHKNK